MNIKSINYRGKELLIKQVSEREYESLKRTDIKIRYINLLSLILNRKISINDFDGNLNELHEITNRVMEVASNGK